ncbi:hypothetical protein [Pontibacillus yanchengensis]|uniref:Uncharacterized protein n=1 Tax=Pontibacillus yanchengensis Y32 TaxID=1385514 RepID=A0A0A2TUY3_9BACI|nr:hypothetical protein [Pontibacillus yanchengensis]KGP73105.1 hypothetical protein N782_07450 [Pontibacillus yanchengensis Y32]
MNKNYLEQFYTIDEDGDYIIEIAIEDYDDIFNTWDSSVYNVRDLDSSLRSFIEDCSRDIDTSEKIALRFNVSKETQDKELEEKITDSIRNFFEYHYFVTSKQVHKRRKKSLWFILISTLFTLLSFYFQNATESGLFEHFLLESLTVGGWIFMWEAFSILFIQSSDDRKKKREYKRLIHAPLLFRY